MLGDTSPVVETTGINKFPFQLDRIAFLTQNPPPKEIDRQFTVTLKYARCARAESGLLSRSIPYLKN